MNGESFSDILGYDMRQKNIFPNITVDSGIRFGKPVIEGTRVPVDLVVGKIAGGMGVNDVMLEYDLKKHQVLAALRYAANLVATEEVAVA